VYLTAIVYRNNLVFLCFLSLFSLQFTLAQVGTTQELSATSILDKTSVSNMENVAAFFVLAHAAADVGFDITQDSNTEIVEVAKSNQCGKSFQSSAVAKSYNSTHFDTFPATTKQVIDWIKNSSSAVFFSVKNIFVTAVPSAKLFNSAILNQYFKRACYLFLQKVLLAAVLVITRLRLLLKTLIYEIHFTFILHDILWSNPAP
jgi:hypothetical protein